MNEHQATLALAGLFILLIVIIFILESISNTLKRIEARNAPNNKR